MPRLKMLRPRVGMIDTSRVAPVQRDRSRPVDGFNYNTRRWRRLSVAYRTAHPLCERCKAAGRVTLAQHVDHRVAIDAGGDPWDEANFEALCRACHSRKTAREDGGFGNVPQGGRLP